MLLASLPALAQSVPEKDTELVEIVGVSKDGRFAVIEVNEEVHNIREIAGKTRRMIAIDALGGERKQWLLSSEINPKADRNEEPELWKRWEELSALPGPQDYGEWAKSARIDAITAGERCGSAERYAEILAVDVGEEAPKGAWKGADFTPKGAGYIVYGVERSGHLWEHGAHPYAGKWMVWQGGVELTMGWSADCSRIVWVERDTLPEGVRDGYEASYDRGRIVEVRVLPAGSSVAVVGSPEKASPIVATLQQRGFGAVAAELSFPAGPAPVIYAWSKAEAAAKELAAALPGANVETKMPADTSFDIVVVAAKK